MDVTVTDKSLTEVVFQVNVGGDITAMLAGVSASVSYNGSTGSLSASVDVWPSLTTGQQQQMQLIKTKIDEAVTGL